MENEIFHNVFGEEISGEPQPRKRSFVRENEDGETVPDYRVCKYTDEDGFDLRNVEGNGSYKIDIRLAKGTRLCRYGFESGKYTTYVGAIYEQLSLPWDIRTAPYYEYEVIADGLEVELIVTKGVVGPQEAFESEGGEIQFLHKYTIREEIEERNTLRRIDYDHEIGRKDPRNISESNERDDK